MGVLKAKVDGAWVEVGGAGIGVAAGGTTGQILTKTSAADYATAWTSTPPILANNTYLRGYKVDGTTPQNLIGMTSTDDISIGSGLAAGKNVIVPPLTVQGPLTLQADSWITGSNGLLVLAAGADGKVYCANSSAIVFNASGGGGTFSQNLTVQGTLYKGAVAYVHPDFVFEHHFTGGIERFRDAPGADAYEGLWPLARVEEFAQEHWRLPGHAARENDRVDIFRRTHDLLAECERLYLHLFDLEKRLAALEGR